MQRSIKPHRSASLLVHQVVKLRFKNDQKCIRFAPCAVPASPFLSCGVLPCRLFSFLEGMEGCKTCLAGAAIARGHVVARMRFPCLSMMLARLGVAESSSLAGLNRR